MLMLLSMYLDFVGCVVWVIMVVCEIGYIRGVCNCDVFLSVIDGMMYGDDLL